MKSSMLAGMGNALSKIWLWTILSVMVCLASSCSTVNLDSAKALSVTGHNVAVQAQDAAIVSDKDYRRARDSEALLAVFSSATESTSYQEILSLHNDIHQELAQRAVVFEKLSDLYDAFGELAGLDSGAQTEKALGDLGGAIQEYAKVIKEPPPQFSDVTAVISTLGGLVATEIQKAKIKEASRQIRTRDEAFLELLDNKLIRRQMVGFKKRLYTGWKAALITLWDSGVYDPKPLIDDLGAPAGLVAQNNAASLVKSNPKLQSALKEVLEKRLALQTDLIEQAYDASLRALRNLVEQHKKLEEGAPVDLTRLRAIVAQLQNIATLIGGVKKDKSTSQ